MSCVTKHDNYDNSRISRWEDHLWRVDQERKRRGLNPLFE